MNEEEFDYKHPNLIQLAPHYMCETYYQQYVHKHVSWEMRRVCSNILITTINDNFAITTFIKNGFNKSQLSFNLLEAAYEQL